jgi:CubicO group peptidase (beta-lactamase class C family)
MQKIKTALAIGAALIFLLVGICIFFSLIYSPEYVYRGLVWGVLKVKEDRHTYARPIQASAAPFQFSKGSGEEEKAVTQRLELIFGTDRLESYLTSTQTRAFIVVQNDRLVYEHYFNGAQRSTEILSNSATKSFVSALIGIALAEGKINSIEDPITRYLPELANRDPRFRQIRIRHLLMMSSGLRYNDYFFFTSDNSLAGAYPDLLYAALHFPQIIDEPGQHFWYNDYNPQLLGLILERVTGMSVSEFLQTRIWQRVGMEYAASWDLDSPHSGFEQMQGGLSARAIDLAKFGCLYLHEGIWEGQTILPSDWVAASTQESLSSVREDYYPKDRGGVPDDMYYQYMWWGIRRTNEEGDFYAMGRDGQLIYVSPSRNLVIVRLGGTGAPESVWAEAAYKFAEQAEPAQ